MSSDATPVTTPHRTSIGALAWLSDCRSMAVLDTLGGVQWWSVPRLDSPAVFAGLLGTDGGFWTVIPAGAFSASRRYLPDSLVLETTYTTDSGEVVVRDALLFAASARKHDIGRRSPRVLAREVRGSAGAVALRTEFVPRFEYGLTPPLLDYEADVLVARAGPVTLRLHADVALSVQAHSTAAADFTVCAGETVSFALSYHPSYGSDPDTIDAKATDVPSLLDDTLTGWQSWAALHDGLDGPHHDLVARSAVVLQGLTYAPSGVVAAAATTSLPEKLGADRNWDYRYAWLRDLALTLRALSIATCTDEADGFLTWIADAVGQLDGGRAQVVFGVEGERDLTEHTVDHLDGFAGSVPVRVGNAAWTQHQHDVPGQVLNAAWRLRDQLSFDRPTRAMLIGMAERICVRWFRPDSGMWEARDAQRHYLSSKVYCWVGLDRAVALAELVAAEAADVRRWAEIRDTIRAEVLDEGWNADVGAYTGAYDSAELDASVLVLPLVGFLDATDERMRATIDAIEAALGDDGTVRRWRTEQAGFFLCSFWLVECRVLAGEPERARAWFERTVCFGGELGLLAEQSDAASGEQLGNLPQAFSHVGLVNAAWRLQNT